MFTEPNSNYPGMNRWGSATPRVADESAVSQFMASVYRWMSGGLALTGIVALFIASSPAAVNFIFGSRLVFYGLIAAQLGAVFAFTAFSSRATFAQAAAIFLGYCALSGVTFASIFLIYTGASIASVFFVTGGTFLGMSAYGTLTKRNLASWSSFLTMGLFGVVIASLVNLFLQSDAMSFVLSCCSVVVFTGLTAWDTQRIREFAYAGDRKLALNGALMLYLDFVNIFLALLRLFGRRR